MFLALLSKQGLDILLKLSVKWRLLYNASKCLIIVFNESNIEYSRRVRQWKIGPDNIEEGEQYKHLGILCDNIFV